MEADTFADDHDTAGRILRISQNRIRSMSLIHEKLYNSGDLTRVDLGEYSRDLCNEVFELSLTHPLPETDFDTEAVEANIDFAIPFGLILNELLLNATKHAFRGIEEPRLSIRLHPEGDQLMLSVCDNGAGLPEDFELQRSAKLGLQLIDSLVAQLSGSIRFRSDGGTCCILRFPNPAAEPLGSSPSL
jgi:two-component sensor histidine kinase